MDFQEKLDGLIQNVIEYSPKIVGAILMLLIGLWIINNLVKIAEKAMAKSNVSEDIRPFLVSLIGVGLKVLLLFAVAEMVGLETTSFVAVLAAAGFAVGMALQGSLGNFAAGVMILIFKPYRVGDVVEIQDQMGHVKEIQIFNTIVVNFDNTTSVIPNSMAIGDIVRNLSTEKVMRVDMEVYMPYSESFDKVKVIIDEALINTPGVLNDPKPVVGINNFDSHYIVLAIWPYCKTEDYWDVYFKAKENVKAALGANGIKMAYSEGVEMGDIGK